MSGKTTDNCKLCGKIVWLGDFYEKAEELCGKCRQYIFLWVKERSLKEDTCTECGVEPIDLDYGRCLGCQTQRTMGLVESRQLR